MTDPSCCRRRRAVDDPFFSRCNRIALHHWGTIFYIEEHKAVSVMEMDVDSTEKEIRTMYPCCIPGCHKTFHTITECEKHFDEQHVYQCGECHQILSCNHLLELHLQEAHDSFFAAGVERKQASYACLVVSCTSVFSSLEQRQQHLASQHSYPKWFRFTTTKERMEILKKKQKWLHNHNQHSLPPPETMEAVMQVDTADERKARRREYQKKKRASIPCRYFLSKDGCWRGDSCMFLHRSEAHASNGEENVYLSSLVHDMERKAKVSVPDKICFGYRRKGPY